MADSDTQSSTLPLWVAVACCVAATFLVFGNTLPALEERRELDHVESDLATLHRRYAAAIQLARRAGARGDSAPALDLQSLFVAIDQKGYTVAEFCAAHASKDAAEPDAGGHSGR